MRYVTRYCLSTSYMTRIGYREAVQEEADDIDAGGDADSQAAQVEAHVLPAGVAGGRHRQEDLAQGPALRFPCAGASFQALLLLPPQARQVPSPPPPGTINPVVAHLRARKISYGI